MADQIFHRKTQTVELQITGTEAGVAFAEADSKGQVSFLIGMAGSIESWDKSQSWPMQCRYIVDLMSNAERRRVAFQLDTLMEHLNERVYEPAVQIGENAAGANVPV